MSSYRQPQTGWQERPDSIPSSAYLRANRCLLAVLPGTCCFLHDCIADYQWVISLIRSWRIHFLPSGVRRTDIRVSCGWQVCSEVNNQDTRQSFIKTPDSASGRRIHASRINFPEQKRACNQCNDAGFYCLSCWKQKSMWTGPET